MLVEKCYIFLYKFGKNMKALCCTAPIQIRKCKTNQLGYTVVRCLNVITGLEYRMERRMYTVIANLCNWHCSPRLS